MLLHSTLFTCIYHNQRTVAHKTAVEYKEKLRRERQFRLSHVSYIYYFKLICKIII